MYLIELDETNRLSLISSFYLNPFQSYSQKTIFVNRSKGHNSHIVGQIIIKPMFLVDLMRGTFFSSIVCFHLLRFSRQSQIEPFHKIQDQI